MNISIVSTSTATTAQPAPYDYLTYLNFEETAATLLLQLLALPLDINLLITSAFYPQRLAVGSGAGHGGLSKSMVTLISVHIVAATLQIPYEVYVIMGWSPPVTQPRPFAIYDPLVLFWLGLSSGLYIVVSPLAVFFLTLDRFLTLTFGHGYGRRGKALFVWVEIVTLGVATVGLTGLKLLLEWPLRLDLGKR